ncbi:MAG: glycosyltransferase [Bacteroidota bacterium]|nr:glycosyltransferase [Bacteroidota bacterium]
MISIIIPTLNEEKLLPQLLAQFPASVRHLHDVELVVSDGGSSDATTRIATAHGAVVVTHEADHRQTIAEGRNTGAAAARGEILVFINADIRISDVDAFFADITRCLAARGVAGVTARVRVFPEEEILSDRIFHFWHNHYVRFLNAIGEGMGRGECQVVRSGVFSAVGGYNAAMVAGEDYDLFRRIRRKGKIVMMKNTVIYESPRRFRKYGYLHILWGWTRNALAVIFRNKSSSEEWEAVR